jgi:NTE family protein
MIKLPKFAAFALGGGAARGFAHIGVIKVLEANGIKLERPGQCPSTGRM